MPFLLWHFSPGDKIENCPAQFLAVCWIVRVEFKLHRAQDIESLKWPSRAGLHWNSCDAPMNRIGLRTLALASSSNTTGSSNTANGTPSLLAAVLL